MTEFSETGPPVTTADVDAFEAKIGSPLPEDYRRFLLTTNGGVPSDNTVDEPSRDRRHRGILLPRRRVR